MKKFFILLLFPLFGYSQQWDLTNKDLTIQVVKNGSITFQIGKWLSNFAVVGDSVSVIYQRNQDNSHFALYIDKDSVNTPTIASATALYDTLVEWTKQIGPIGPTGPTGATGATGFIDIDSCYTRLQSDTFGCGTTLYVDAPSGTTFNGNVDLGLFDLSATSIYATLVHVHNAIDMADTSHTNHLFIKLGDELTANKTLTLFVNDGSRVLTIAGDATISGTNTGDQSLANTSDATSHTVTLTGGTSTQFVEGSNITLTTTGTGANGIVTIASTGGGGANTALSNLASVAINTTLLPGSDDAIDLGSDVFRFHYIPLKIASGFIGWGTGGGDGAIIVNGTAGNSTMDFINAAAGYKFDAKIFPSANNTIPLGIQNTNEFSDAFFGSGAVIGFNNNNMTLTHSAAVLTVGGGDLKVTSAGNASTSVLTTSATQTITGLKTFNDNVFEWNNPATTFQYRVRTSAIGADVDLTLPAFHQNERIAVEDYTGQVTGDRTSTSTSLADVTDLAAFSTAANTKYYFSFDLSVTTNATTVGILLSVNHSTAVTSIRFNIMYPISATASNVQQNLTTLDGGVQPTAGNGATIQPARVWGIMTTNAAGTFALRFASETGAAVVVKAGSTGILSRVN